MDELEFVIPVNKDDLMNHHIGQFYVQAVISPRCLNQALEAAKNSLQKERAKFILDHFEDFFSILVHGNKVDIAMFQRGYTRLVSAVKFLADDMSEEKLQTNRQMTLTITKMLIYLLSNFMCYLENNTIESSGFDTGKKKKSAKNAKSDLREEWENRRNEDLLTIHKLLQLPLHKLWNPPTAEESFVMLISDICYKIIENERESRSGGALLTVWHILGILVKRYLHGMTCSIKIIQLVKMYDTLAPILAQGVVSIIIENDCPSFMGDITREVNQGNVEEAEARNISAFFEAVAKKQPKLMLPILDNILDYLEKDSYVMRNCAIEVIEAVILGCLAQENLSDDLKEKRDECLECLTNHMLDAHAYVRSKVFQTWQKLICERGVPMQRIVPLLVDVIPHLDENSATMRKQSLQLLRVLLQCNPFNDQLDKMSFERNLTKLTEQMKRLQADVISESSVGDETRLEFWNEMAPKIFEVIHEDVDDENEEEEEEEEENEDEEKEIDADEEFEKIRELIYKQEFVKAVKSLKFICKRLNYENDMAEMDKDSKEHCYLLFLLKIFLQSEKNGKSDMEKFNSREWKRRKEEIKSLKRMMNYTDDGISFIKTMESVVDKVTEMLYAQATVVAVEACAFIGAAYQFKLTGFDQAICTALNQVYSREESVKNNVADIYKEIYLKSEEQLTCRQKAIASVKGLTELYKSLKAGQSTALVQLIKIWFKKEELDEDFLQVLWERYTFKTPGTTVLDSRCAIVLLTISADYKPQVISTNLNTLIRVGLKGKGKEDVLLARDTLRALLKHPAYSDDKKKPLRFTNDHELFEEIHNLFCLYFEPTPNEAFASFASEAINVVYHLANQPHLIAKKFLKYIVENEIYTTYSGLAKLHFVVGHIAIKHMIFLDTSVYKELKRRNAARNVAKGKKKAGDDKETTASSARKARKSFHRSISENNTENNDEEALIGATADDTDAEFINNVLENNIVDGDGFLKQFIPQILDVCIHPENYDDDYVQVWSVLALTKFMTVSSKFCDEHLRLLVTILERSNSSDIKCNVLIGLSDLMIRFPNEVESSTLHMYKRLHDEDVRVRGTALKVISNLIKREMIRVKGQISEVALCLVDADETIKHEAQEFFLELSQKGNVLYNVIPDIVSRLTSVEATVTEQNKKYVLKFIFDLLQKEREIENLLTKICSRFAVATTEKSWEDLSYCLSLLHLGKKGVTRLVDNLPHFRNKIRDPHVSQAFRTVIENAKKKPDTKDACALLEAEIEKLMNADKENEDKDRKIMPPPAKPARKGASKKKQVESDNSSSSSSSSSSSDEDDNPPKKSKTPSRTSKATKRKLSTRSSNGRLSSSSSNTESPAPRPTRKSRR